MKRLSKHSIPKNPSILIILMGSLGDLVRGLALAGHIKTHIPGSRITWLVEPAWVKIAALNREIDRLIVFDRPKGVFALPDLYRELSGEKFHITLDLQRHFKSGVFSLLSGAPRRIGFHGRNAKEFNRLFNTETISFREETFPKLDHYLMFTDHLGLPRPVKPDFGFGGIEAETVYPALHGIKKPFVALVMGSSWESKDWTFEGYLGLAKEILEQGRFGVVLLGDKSKASEGATLAEKLNNPDLTNLAGKTTLMELIAVLKAAAACVGPDSGPAHLAGAVDTRYVSLFGPTCPVRVAPYGSEDLVVTADAPCAPCYKKKCADNFCMSSITVSAVMEKLQKALES